MEKTDIPAIAAGLTKAILIAAALTLTACDARTMAAQDLARAKQNAAEEFNRPYNACIYRVTGPFGTASYQVMKECERQACLTIKPRHAGYVVQCREYLKE